MSRALVIGYGSIGKRHAKVLRALGNSVSVVSRRNIPFHPQHSTIGKAVRAERPDYAVIAVETSAHHRALQDLKSAHFKGRVLVEKPLFDRRRHFEPNGFKDIFVAYNLRFNPCLLKLKKALRSEKVISAQVYAGGYLPDWRSDTDYAKSYSSKRRLGGGVIRDLSHEWDYLLWLFGSWQAIAASGGHFSRLKGDSEDVCAVLMRMKKCPLVTVQMNYLDRVGRREILINTENHTWKADLARGEFWKDGKMTVCPSGRDESYRAQHRAVLQKKRADLCGFKEGMEVMRMIEAIEKAGRTKKWVSR